MLTSEESTTVDHVDFAQFSPDQAGSLVFQTTSWTGGNFNETDLVIVEFDGGVATVGYIWSGESLRRFEIVGPLGGQRVVASASYWAPLDAHCCPSRHYRFTVAWKDGALQTVTDNRPWLGISGREALPDAAHPDGRAVRVTTVWPGSPASSALRNGDLLLGVQGASPSPTNISYSPAVIDEIALMKAGQSVTLLVLRGSAQVEVPVELGSLADPSAGEAAPSGWPDLTF
ncbi:MAG: S1C family serine protease [Actinomycetota bacterium]|nr:S1C family serine protease [Actinomycetota bacterium]